MMSLFRTAALLASVAAGALGAVSPPAHAQEDPVAYAKQVVEAARAGKMSRAPLNEAGVVWTGAETSPPPIKGATVAVMPCPLALVVCQYHDASSSGAGETGQNLSPGYSRPP